MAQQFNYPNSETELRAIQDELYRTAKDAHDTGNRPSFGGLIEIMSAKATIITAIHNIKANKGANTPGVDGISILSMAVLTSCGIPLHLRSCPALHRASYD